MRLALHIFRKDVRRLWWETLVATGALAYLAHMNANRMDYLPGPMEGLMNIVVPAAWAFLDSCARYRVRRLPRQSD